MLDEKELQSMFKQCPVDRRASFLFWLQQYKLYDKKRAGFSLSQVKRERYHLTTICEQRMKICAQQMYLCCGQINECMNYTLDQEHFYTECLRIKKHTEANGHPTKSIWFPPVRLSAM